MTLLLAALPAPLLLSRAAAAETIEIRPNLSYTVAEVRGDKLLHKRDYLYSNGYTTGTYDEKATIARMEFTIPPAVLAGLQTIQFEAGMGNVLPCATGYTYLWYYPGRDEATLDNFTKYRTGFTAKGLTENTTGISRNLLEGTNNAPTSEVLMEKLGLALTTNCHTQHNDWFTFTDPRLVITYEPPPEDNAKVVAKLLSRSAASLAGQTDPALVGFDADPDQDGSPNFMEIWRGTAPDKADRPAAPVYGTTPPNAAGQRFAFVKLEVSGEGDNYLLVDAEASHDLADWRDISASRAVLNQNGKRHVTFTDSRPVAQTGACYFRFISEEDQSKFSD